MIDNGIINSDWFEENYDTLIEEYCKDTLHGRSILDDDISDLPNNDLFVNWVVKKAEEIEGKILTKGKI